MMKIIYKSDKAYDDFKERTDEEKKRREKEKEEQEKREQEEYAKKAIENVGGL